MSTLPQSVQFKWSPDSKWASDSDKICSKLAPDSYTIRSVCEVDGYKKYAVGCADKGDNLDKKTCDSMMKEGGNVYIIGKSEDMETAKAFCEFVEKEYRKFLLLKARKMFDSQGEIK